MLKYFLTIYSLVIITNSLSAQIPYDTLLLDGTEQLVAYGMDTTQHWWALTEPFFGQYRLTVDGKQSNVYQEITKLIFSPDGNRWACFAQDRTNFWYVLTNDTIIPLRSTGVGDLAFSPNSEVLIYSFKDETEETVVIGNRRIRVYNRESGFYFSHGAERFAFTGYRGNSVIININGNESSQFDEIRPIGFWFDGEMLYAGKNGDRWQIYKNMKAISDNYRDFRQIIINLAGNAVAATAVRQSGGFVTLLISDDYYEPLVTKPYSYIDGLVLHPTIPLAGFMANYEGTNYVVLSSAEYAGGQSCGLPKFSYDGSEFYFVGCDSDCFVCINGKRYPVQFELSTNAKYALKPGSRTIAHVSSTSMIIRMLENRDFVLSKMLDEVISPRYNWRSGCYETLGRINQRLYLLICRV